jgi:predicted CDP-diglyceride synthetase/phosphatidate cytidylyltransferase
MIMSTMCLLARGITSLIIILDFSTIQAICTDIYGFGFLFLLFTYNKSTDTELGRRMAISYVIIMAIFLIVEILLALISLIQCSKSKEDYAIAEK